MVGSPVDQYVVGACQESQDERQVYNDESQEVMQPEVTYFLMEWSLLSLAVPLLLTTFLSSFSVLFSFASFCRSTSRSSATPLCCSAPPRAALLRRSSLSPLSLSALLIMLKFIATRITKPVSAVRRSMTSTVNSWLPVRSSPLPRLVPPLPSASSAPPCLRCEEQRHYRLWMRATLSLLLGYGACRWWQQHHDKDEYPVIKRKTYPTPIRPPPAILPVPDPPPVLRVAANAATPSVSSSNLRASPFPALAASLASLLVPPSASSQASLEGVDPPRWRGWPHDGPTSAFDAASLRRGFEVYRQVCSACHSLQWIRFRQLIGVTHTEEQARALARSVLVVDGPNEEGQMYERPGTLADSFPPPYPNEEFARFVNNGASDSH